MKMKTFRIVTLGCRTNQYESEAYGKQLEAMGLRRADSEEADLCIVNTCTVTASADSSSRHQIRQLIRRNPNAKVHVTGCLAERVGDELKSIDGVTSVISNLEKEKLIEKLFPDAQNLPEFSIEQFAAHTRAFVKVQDGCNSFCTYCIIPYVRGRSRSRKLEEVLKEVKQLVANGYKEVVLTGVNIGDYDGGVKKGEEPVNLARLIREVDQVEGLERIRVSSIDPDEVDQELADAIVHGKKTCHSMHIVLQSGSNTILKRMNRKYTKQMFCQTIEYLKKRSPDFTFTTDVIVGFPGESETDFNDTLEMIEFVKFSKVHMFPYSDRPRTRSNLYENKVSDKVKEERRQIVLRSAEKHAYLLREQFIGRKMHVLLESEERSMPGYISGHTANFLPVLVKGEGLQSNQIIEVELAENTPSGLIGNVIMKRSENSILHTVGS